jgi:hypothetical protein
MTLNARPVIVNYGMGVDSTAVLVGLHQRGERPDLVIFADTGAEKPETYAYLDVINAWLRSVGFPEVTVVKYRPTIAPYDSLEGNCLANETLPSIAFRGGSTFDGGCSLKFKGDVMDAWIMGKTRGPWKGDGWAPFHFAKAYGIKAVKLIGFDDSPADRKRTVKAARRTDEDFDFRYPLQEWSWDRERCIEEIKKSGLPVPLKSACFFCPSSKKWEIRWLAAKHPELFLRAIAIEDLAAAGKHGLEEKFRWRKFAEAEGFLRGNEVVGDREALMAKAMAEKPAHEANDDLIQIGGCA